MGKLVRPNVLHWQNLYEGDDAVPIFTQHWSLEGDFTTHAHDFVELVLIVDGHGKHLSLLGEQELSAGDGVILLPGAWHAYRSCQPLTLYNCCFSQTLLQKELAWISEVPVLREILGTELPLAERHGVRIEHLDEQATQRCAQQLAAIHSIKQANYLSEKAAILGHLLLFLAQLAQQFEKKQDDGTKKDAAGRVIPSLVLQGMHLLNEQLARAWTLQALAHQLSINRSYLVRLFTQHIGLSPMAYLARRRSERATQLLVSTDLPIAAIGECVGWPEARHFARCFKAQMGLSASAYRAKFFSPVTQADRTHQIVRGEMVRLR